METTVVNGSGTETGQVITTTVGGRDGKPKQVIQLTFLLIAVCLRKAINHDSHFFYEKIVSLFTSVGCIFNLLFISCFRLSHTWPSEWLEPAHSE